MHNCQQRLLVNLFNISIDLKEDVKKKYQNQLYLLLQPNTSYRIMTSDGAYQWKLPYNKLYMLQNSPLPIKQQKIYNPHKPTIIGFISKDILQHIETNSGVKFRFYLSLQYAFERPGTTKLDTNQAQKTLKIAASASTAPSN